MPIIGWEPVMAWIGCCDALNLHGIGYARQRPPILSSNSVGVQVSTVIN